MVSGNEIQSLYEQGRSERFDWLPEKATEAIIAERMVAMANTAGGQIVLGVSEDGTLNGIDKVDDAVDRLIQAALDITPPLIIPVPQSATLKEKQVVVALIPAGMPSVYAYEGRYLKREQTNNLPLSPQELRRLMLERGELSYETQVHPTATLDDLDWDKIRDYVKNLRGTGNSDEKTIMIQRGCLTQSGGEHRPTNAGILLFGKAPQHFIRCAEIAAVRFAGDTMTDKHNRQDIGGTLIDQIKRAETFLIDHLRKDVTLSDTMARSETYEYPLEAARELVVNAVAHRDYSIAGDTIRLFIYGNRMEVHSPGRLPGPMTLANLKDERFSRNPIIVQVLADMHFIERLGYGVDRVIELMKQQNLSEPMFTERNGGFTVTLQNRVEVEGDAESEDPAPTKSDDVVFDGTYRGHAINPRQESTLKYLHKTSNTRITNSDLQQLFPDVHPETIRRDLVDLVNKDILVKMGQKRGSYYVLRREDDASQTEADS
ncbi:MAG: putative DNA binding domain-containing protein [Anaerolineae bacterium]|nr:putative DNA binding domain-containing protein [Anaerolineae bacterium]MCA9888474.1 putative DNA binding domain-containing protein [Anaerolineae bacterium]MCA9892207.1 putative DNA binding domain-containing protein [Anaerolineae bacterium]